MQLIDDWKNAWKFLSVHILTLLLVMPDAYNAVAAMGWMDQLPEPAMWVIRCLAGVGIIARLVKQRKEQQ